MLGMVECLHSARSKFLAESVSERIFEIGKNLTKLQPTFDSLLFLECRVRQKNFAQLWRAIQLSYYYECRNMYWRTLYIGLLYTVVLYNSSTAAMFTISLERHAWCGDALFLCGSWASCGLSLRDGVQAASCDSKQGALGGGSKYPAPSGQWPPSAVLLRTRFCGRCRISIQRQPAAR